MASEADVAAAQAYLSRNKAPVGIAAPSDAPVGIAAGAPQDAPPQALGFDPLASQQPLPPPAQPAPTSGNAVSDAQAAASSSAPALQAYLAGDASQAPGAAKAAQGPVQAQQAEQNAALQGVLAKPSAATASQMADEGKLDPAIAQKLSADESANKAIASASKPTPKDLQTAAQEILAPVREFHSSQIANDTALQEHQAFMADTANDKARTEAELQKNQDKQDASVRSSSLTEIMNGGGFGQKLGASIAVLLGGVSQGLTGAKTNPVMDFLDSEVKRQAEKDKLTLSQRESLRKHLLGVAENTVRERAEFTGNEIKKQHLLLEAQTLALKKQEVLMQQRALLGQSAQQETERAINGGKAVADRSLLNKEQSASAIRMPDGSYKVAKSPEAAKELDKAKNNIDVLMPAIDNAKKMIFNMSALDRAAYASNTPSTAAKELLSQRETILAGLKSYYEGKGERPLADAVYKRLSDSTFSTAAIVANPQAAVQALTDVQSGLYKNYKTFHSNAGADLPPSAREVAMQKIMQQSGFTESQANNAISLSELKPGGAPLPWMAPAKSADAIPSAAGASTARDYGVKYLMQTNPRMGQAEAAAAFDRYMTMKTSKRGK